MTKDLDLHRHSAAPNSQLAAEAVVAQSDKARQRRRPALVEEEAARVEPLAWQALEEEHSQPERAGAEAVQPHHLQCVPPPN